jgi:hypothetical protein
MTSLSANFNVGTGSASSLVKSATTLQNDLNSYNDEVQKVTFENSGYTDSSTQAYLTYLNSRVSSLQSSGTVTDQTKAVELQQEMVTAQHSNISYHIQQENIQLMSQGDSGTVAGYQSKMSVIASQYNTAVSIGDTTLADSLESQYYSTSQSMQTAEQTAATAAQTLNNTAASTGAANNEHVATTLTDTLKELNNAMSEAGPNGANTAIQNWMKSSNITQTLTGLGIKVPGGAAPNYFDIVSGVTQAIAQSHYLAAQAMQGSSDTSAPLDVQTYYNDYTNIMYGITKTDTLAGSMSLSDVQEAAANKNMYVASENGDGTWSYKISSITGYQTEGTTTNVNGQTVPNVVPEYSGLLSKTTADPKVVSNTGPLAKLGFTVITQSGDSITNGYQVEASDKLPSYLQRLMPSKNATFYIQVNPKGNMQFVIPNSTGSDQIITLATDTKGLTGAFNVTNGKPQAIGGQYGFDESANTLISAATIVQTKNTALQNVLQKTPGTGSITTPPKPGGIVSAPAPPGTTLTSTPKAAPLPKAPVTNTTAKPGTIATLGGAVENIGKAVVGDVTNAVGKL